jgi:hypothetical protein
MAEPQDTTQSKPTTTEQPPGGRSSRGPETSTRGERDLPEAGPGTGAHGWAPDAPGEGEAKEQAIKGHQKAQDPAGTQDASRGAGGYGADPDAPPPGVGESTTRRGEDIEEQEGKDAGRYDTGTKGPAERPTGKSTPRDSTSIDVPEDTTGPTQPAGDQGG